MDERLRLEPILQLYGRRPFHVVRVWFDGRLIHSDTVHLEAADARRRFAEELLERLRELEPNYPLTLADLENELLGFSDTGEPPATSDPAGVSDGPYVVL